jgi:hypothetical protein
MTVNDLTEPLHHKEQIPNIPTRGAREKLLPSHGKMWLLACSSVSQ